MDGKENLKKYDRDDARFAEYLAQLLTERESLKSKVTNCQDRLTALEPVIANLQKMTKDDFIEAHPDKNYTGIMKGKVGGKEFKIK